MTRILNYGGMYLVPDLQRAGHEVCSAGMFAGCDFVMQYPVTVEKLLQHLAANNFVPDVFLYEDDGNLPFLLNIENIPCVSLFYSIDTFCNPWHASFTAASDFVFVAQKDYVSIFAEEGRACEWLPLFFTEGTGAGQEDAVHFAQRDLPVSFVGTLHPKNIPERLPFLEQFRRFCPLVALQGDFHPIFARSRIVLNQTAVSEVNFRCFEAMSLGAALLMEDCENGLRELFTPRETILPVYPRGNAKAAAAIAQEWLARPADLAAVACAGQQIVLQKHSSANRAQEIMRIAERLVAEHAQTARLTDLLRRTHLVGAAYGMIAAELTDSTMQQLRNFFLNLQKSKGGE